MFMDRQLSLSRHFKPRRPWTQDPGCSSSSHTLEIPFPNLYGKIESILIVMQYSYTPHDYFDDEETRSGFINTQQLLSSYRLD